MDTRTKIVPSFESLGMKIVIGYFDPMHAGHVRRLHEICNEGERIAVILADPPEPILPAQARAELVAALDCVAAVVVAAPDTETTVAEYPNIIDERPADARRSRMFAQHVLARYNAT